MNKGQFSILGIVITTGGMLLASAFTSWGIASTKISDVNTEVQVIEEREENHYKELSSKLDSIEQKLDRLLNK